jgi:hypothetical protein
LEFLRNTQVKRWAIVATLTVVAVTGIVGAGLSIPMPNAPENIPVPEDREGVMVYRAALRARGTKIMVSTEAKRLWLISGKDTLMNVPIAIGLGNTFTFKGKSYKFTTPRGKRIVRGKMEKPVWTVPEWHYYEKAAARGLEVVELKADEPYMLQDSTFIETRGDQVGRVNKLGNWWPFSQDFEIQFDKKIFMPPLATVQRRVTDVLGPFKLDMGDGYLIHGTHSGNEDSIGSAASHGCVRMRNADLTELYPMVKTGTRIFIF